MKPVRQRAFVFWETQSGIAILTIHLNLAGKKHHQKTIQGISTIYFADKNYGNVCHSFLSAR